MTATSAWLSRPLRSTARAWCSDCPWTWTGSWAHKHGNNHTETLGHLTHVDDGEPLTVDNSVDK